MTTAQIGDLANTQDPNPFLGFITDPLSPLSQPTISAYQDPNNAFGISVPFPQFTSFSGDSPPIANSIYHAGQFRAEKSFSGGLQFLVTYTVSKSIDNGSATDDSISWLGGGFNGDTLGVQDPYNLRAERSVSTFDRSRVTPEVLARRLAIEWHLAFRQGEASDPGPGFRESNSYVQTATQFERTTTNQPFRAPEYGFQLLSECLREWHVW